MRDLLISSPLWTLFLFSLVPLTIKLCRQNKTLSFKTSCLWVFIACVISAILLFVHWPAPQERFLLFSSALALDSFRAFCSLLLLFVMILVTLMSVDHPHIEKKLFPEILFLKMGALLGLLILLWSHNLLIAFIGLELASLAFYLLIALGHMGFSALRASFKYFVLGSIASAILLYGICFFIGSTGHFELQSLFSQSPDLINYSRLLNLGLVFIVAGFLFKISIFPFQFWLPDVYQGSFVPLLVFMAVGFKISVLGLLAKWTEGMFQMGFFPNFLSILQWLAVLSVLFGNIIALLQKDFKKMLLFSTIAHSGYLLMLLVSIQMGFDMGKAKLLYYFLIYMFMTGGIFLALRIFEKTNGIKIHLSNLKGLAYKKPLYAFLILVFLLSLAGIPPTGGFIAKLFVFQSLIDKGLWWVLLWTILGSTIALYYYLRPVAYMYIKEDKENLSTTEALFPLLKYTLIIMGVFILCSGLFPAFFYFG